MLIFFACLYVLMWALLLFALLIDPLSNAADFAYDAALICFAAFAVCGSLLMIAAVFV